MSGSEYILSLFTTVLLKFSRPAPKQKLFFPFLWTENVDVVLSGLNSDGILYDVGDGEFCLDKLKGFIIIIYLLVSSGNIESDCNVLNEIKCRNNVDEIESVDELDGNDNSASEKNIRYMNEMNLVNNFINNADGGVVIQSAKPKEKRDERKNKYLNSEKLCSKKLKDKQNNSYPKKNKKKKK